MRQYAGVVQMWCKHGGYLFASSFEEYIRQIYVMNS